MSKLQLFQLTKGYRYNSDTTFLYAFLHQFKCKGSVLDVGAGCGILGLLIKRDFPKCDVDLIDFQDENVALCKENGALNSLDVNVEKGDFLEFSNGIKYNMIVSNPPYYHEGVQKSEIPHLAKSRYNTHLPFDKFTKQCYNILKDKGVFCFCYDAKQIEDIFYVLKGANFAVEYVRFVYSKSEKSSSLVLVYAKKNSKTQTQVLPPFLVNEKFGYTDEAKEAFSLVNTVSLIRE